MYVEQLGCTILDTIVRFMHAPATTCMQRHSLFNIIRYHGIHCESVRGYDNNNIIIIMQRMHAIHKKFIEFLGNCLNKRDTLQN